MDSSDIPKIVHHHAASAGGTTSALSPGTTGSTRQEREPYSARQARRDQQRQAELQAQQGGRGWSNDIGENPYLSHLRPRAAGYAGSEVSSSSIGGTSMGGGSSIYSSSMGGNHSHTGGYSRSPSGSAAGPSGRIIYTPDDRRSGSTTGSQSMSPPLLSPIPQRRISPNSFVLNKDDHDGHSLRSASRTQPGAGATSQKKGTSSFLSIPPGGSTSQSTSSRKRRSAKSSSTDVDSPLRRWVRYLNMELGLSSGSMIAVCLGLVALLKWLIGLGGYSGRADHPRKGDFEAQRFWMDLTVNEKCGVRWYEVGGVGDGDWWRLDYPPLTAYVSWVFGKIGQALLPASFAGHSSRGNESLALTAYMRWTVLALESISWWPVVVLWCWSGWGVGTRSKRTRMVTILSILLQPSLILIDNGHFQYNSFPIAMTLLAVYLFQSNRDVLGAVAFSASLLFKQMGLYWSPAVFGYLLGKCVWVGGEQGLILFAKIGVTTASTFLLAFAPFLRPFPSALGVLLGRIFPLQRGIFEDKVANFWCASNVVFKWKNWFETGSMAKLATLATLLAITPTLAILIWTSYRLRRPISLQSTSPGLPPTAPLIPLALFTSSMAFFLFSFQVHEKSILVPLLSVYMLLGEKGEGRGTVWDGAVGLLNVATFSMYPLLKRDDQTLQYVVWTLGWNYLVGYNPIKVVNLKLRWIGYLVYALICAHQFAEAFITPPTRYPDIYPVTNTLLSFGVFGLTWLIASWKLLEMAVGMVGLGGFGSDAGGQGYGEMRNKEKIK